MRNQMNAVLLAAMMLSGLSGIGFAQTGNAGAGKATVSAPSGGWKVVKDREGVCQFSVPEDWKQALPGSTMFGAPGGKATAVLTAARQSFDATKHTVQQSLKPTKILENSSSRLWYTYELGQERGLHYYVGTPTASRACGAQIDAKGDPGTLEPTMKKIAESVGPAK